MDWWTRFFETLKDMEGGGDTAPKSIFEIAKSMKSAMIEEEKDERADVSRMTVYMDELENLEEFGGIARNVISLVF